MIIQKVIRGIGNITEDEANKMFSEGILCNWWRKVKALPQIKKIERLTETNLEWHQNRFTEQDPDFGNQPFCENTPFISTTAGCIERDTFNHINIQHRAWFEALRFATKYWTTPGYLFYCDLFVLSKKSVAYEQYSEELRELNLYHAYSHFHPEGEVTAKIVIPGVQIEKWEYYDLTSLVGITQGNNQPSPVNSRINHNYIQASEISNLRALI